MYLLKKFTYSIAPSSGVPPNEREHTFDTIRKKLETFTTDKNIRFESIERKNLQTREKNRRRLMDKVKQRSSPKQRSLSKAQSFRRAVKKPFKTLHLKTGLGQYVILQQRSFEILVRRMMTSHLLDVLVLVACGVICGAMLQSSKPASILKRYPLP